MDILVKAEHVMEDWFKKVPHLPYDARKWLGDNLWWMVVVLAVLTAIGVLGLVLATISSLVLLLNPYVTFYAPAGLAAIVMVRTIVSLIFAIALCFLLAFAATPLKEKREKGWYLMFGGIILCAVLAAVTAVLTLNVFTFLAHIVVSAVWLLLISYILFEVRPEFLHTERSKGVKKNA